MRTRPLHIACLILLLIGTSAIWQAASADYKLSDFYWSIQQPDGRHQRTELISKLSRQHLLIGVHDSDPAQLQHKRHRLQELAATPSTFGPNVESVIPGPIGNQFATYRLTAKAPQSLDAIIELLNTTPRLPQVDFALPILNLSKGATAPSIIFTVSVNANRALTDVQSLLRRQPVTILRQHANRYVLQLDTSVNSNLLTVLNAFKQPSDLIDDVQVTWLDIDLSAPIMPAAASDAPVDEITAHFSLDTGWDFPIANLREPISYHLRITRKANLDIRPESLAPAALKRALVRSTSLPGALFDVTQSQRQTQRLDNQRWQETITYTVQFSKPGVYHIPALPITVMTGQAATDVKEIQSQPHHGYQLTIPAYLPVQSEALPGALIAPSIWQRHLSAWPQYAVYGLGASGLILLAAGLLSRTARPHPSVPDITPSASQLRRHYLANLQQLRERMPQPVGSHSPTDRTWLRDGSALLRQLLGDCLTGDAASFRGATGVSAAAIMAHLQSRSISPECQLTNPHPQLEIPLQLLDELGLHATVMAPELTPADYTRLSDDLEQAILRLTDEEAFRVLRNATRT